MKNARVSLSRGWLLGLLVAASVNVSAWAADCPSSTWDGPAASTPTGWEKDTVTGTTPWSFSYISSGNTICGKSINAQPPTNYRSGSGYATMQAAESYLSSYYAAWTKDARCYARNANTWIGEYIVYYYAPNNWRVAFRITTPVVQEACTLVTPQSQTCGSAGDGTRYEVRATDFNAVKTAIGSCFDQCVVQEVTPMGPGINKDANNTYVYSAWIKNTGATCGGAEATPPPLDPGDKPIDEDCVTSSAGVMYCTSDSYGENCGYVNDKYVCLGKTDPDECWVNDDGSRICGESAPMPPKPDNGTRGTPATPTDTIKEASTTPGQSGDTFNYYNTTVMAGSSQASTSGANPARADSTNPSTGTTPTAEQGAGGEGGTDPTSDDSISGGQDCSAPPVCSGDPIACAIADQAWRTHCYPVMDDAALEMTYGSSGLNPSGQFDIPVTAVEVPAAFDASGPIAAACIADYPVNMGSLLGTVTIPFSELCWVMEFIGLLILIGSYVAGAKIVAGGL